MTTFAELMKKKECVNGVAEKQTDAVVTQQPEKVNPLALLRKTLASTQNTKPEKASVGEAISKAMQTKPQTELTPTSRQEEKPEEINTQQISNTIEDISNYVFDEQPEQSTLEITQQFDNLLSSLNKASGADLPDLLAQNLLFIKEHPFLAEILKPESIGHLCNAMRKSYGYVVQAKTERSTKAAKRDVVADAVLGDLTDIGF